MAEPLDSVDALALHGVFSAIDRHLASCMARLSNEPPEVALAAAFASRAVRLGHVCADLPRLSRSILLDARDEPIQGVRLPALPSWLALLRRSALVGSGDEARPLVLDGAGRLYLHRYFRYQRALVTELRTRAQGTLSVDAVALRRSLTELFPDTSDTAADGDLQRLAAVIATLKRFSLISGGPGTGKTHTVLKVLSVLRTQARALAQEAPRMLLLAPTGKAAARLGEAMAKGRELLGDTLDLQDLPTEASTIHRALGYQPRSPTRFAHDAHNPLPIDVLLVDEASMIDLALLTKLVLAVPASARIILLGDKDQLASIEAGAVFGDIYNPDARRGYSSAFAEHVRALTGMTLSALPERTISGIWDSVVHLTRSYRYAESSDIAALARTINQGDGEAALLLLSASTAPATERTNREPARRRADKNRPQLSFEFGAPAPDGGADVSLIDASVSASAERALGASLVSGYAPYCRERDVRQKLRHLARYRILCAHRRGEFGVEALNALAERLLAARGHLGPDRLFYEGRPILVTKNDYQLELFNGDVGVIARDAGGAVRAFFERPDGTLRSVVPARLPAHETVFAMTVHKSQGSEFDHVLLVLPAKPSPVMTRELVYTGVTRARSRVEICATPQGLVQAIRTPVERASGMRDALWSD